MAGGMPKSFVARLVEEAQEPVTNAGETATKPPVADQVTVTPEEHAVPSSQPAAQKRQKRPQKAREAASAVKRASLPPPAEKEDESKYLGFGIRMSPELLEQTKDCAWYSGLDQSEYIRRAIRAENDRRIRENGGPFPPRPVRPSPSS